MTAAEPPSRADPTRSRWRRLLRSRWAPALLIYGVGVLALGRIRPEVVGANDASRYATMIAIVEQGTYFLDAVPLAQRTMDKVQVDGRELSTKPPVLSTLGAALYAVLYRGLGLSFAHHEGVVVTVIVAALCTAPLLLLLWMFHALLRREGGRAELALGATALLGLGTLCFPFATILVNHLPSTTALFAAFFCARELRSGRLRSAAGDAAGWRWAFGAGLAGCAAVTFELTAVFLAAAVTGYLALTLFVGPARRSFPRRPWLLVGAYVAGAALPAALHLWLNHRTTGSVLPVQLRPELWHFAGSYWNEPRSWDALREPKWQYALQCFFGGRGLFTLTPVLLLSLVGLGWGLVRGGGRSGGRGQGGGRGGGRGRHRGGGAARESGFGAFFGGAPARAETVTIALGFAALVTYIVLGTNNYGGGHYGMRWFLMAVPLLFLLLVPVLERWHGPTAWIGLPLLILPGLYTAQIYWFGKPTVYELLMMRHGWLVLPP
jgi:hypothetical protein